MAKNTLKILRCEHRKILKVCLAILQHYALKGLNKASDPIHVSDFSKHLFTDNVNVLLTECHYLKFLLTASKTLTELGIFQRSRKYFVRIFFLQMDGDVLYLYFKRGYRHRI